MSYRTIAVWTIAAFAWATPVAAQAPAPTDRLEIARALIDAKADINLTNSEGATAPHYATEKHHDDVADLLGEHGGKDIGRPVGANVTNQKLAQVSLGGQMNVNFDVQPFQNEISDFAPIQPLLKGDVVAALVSNDIARSIDTVKSRQGKRLVTAPPSDAAGAILMTYPVITMVKSSNGKVHAIFPGVVTIKAKINTGEKTKSGDPQIELTRSVAAGDKVSVIMVDGALLSVDAAPGDQKPWFIAYPASMKEEADRADVIDA